MVVLDHGHVVRDGTARYGDMLYGSGEDMQSQYDVAPSVIGADYMAEKNGEAPV